MSSDALKSLLSGLEEVRDLQRANPTPPGGLPARPQVVRAINRASVVLLSSHLERYLRNVNEEAAASVNAGSAAGSELPELLRLTHSTAPIEKLAEAQWDNRSEMLTELMSTDGWLWGPLEKGQLRHDRLVHWMKSPSPERAARLFRLWGITDIFTVVTRQPNTRQRLWLKLKELVEKRNDIAHGEAEAQATHQDISSYIAVVRDFCTRADVALSRALSVYSNGTRPW